MMIQIGFRDPWIPDYPIEWLLLMPRFFAYWNSGHLRSFTLHMELSRVHLVCYPPPSLGGKMDYKWAPLSSHDKASSLLTLHGFNWGDPTWKICADFFRAGITHIRQNRCCLQACFAACSSISNWATAQALSQAETGQARIFFVQSCMWA